MPEATRARHIVLVLTLLLSAIVYLDRVCISTASLAIKSELALSDSQMGYVFSIYTAAYALFEVPGGWLVDRFGARWMLTRIVVAWSLMTAATGMAWNFLLLFVIRMLFGMGEAGAYPSMAWVYGRWLSERDRGRAFGLTVMAGLLGASLTQPLVVTLLGYISWRSVFPLFGAVGIIWAVGWFWWFRDNPGAHPAVNEAELAAIGSHATEIGHVRVPWRRLWSNRSLRALCLMYCGTIYGWYFYLTWLPHYLYRARGFELKAVGWLSALPLLSIAVGVLAGGWVSDALVTRWGPRLGRRLPGLIGLPVAAVAIVRAVTAPGPVGAALAVAVAAGFSALGVAPAWATCLDIGRRNAGVISGAMNTFGNLGGALSPVVVGVLLDHWHSWNAPLYTVAVLYLGAAAAWFWIDPQEKLEEIPAARLPSI
ncbi:MAG: MFS transporter [Acidobacteriota bacterium]